MTRGLSRCGFGVPFRVLWRPFGTPDGRFLGTLEAVLGHVEAVLAPPLHEKMHVLACTLLESFRPPPRGRKLNEPVTLNAKPEWMLRSEDVP